MPIGHSKQQRIAEKLRSRCAKEFKGVPNILITDVSHGIRDSRFEIRVTLYETPVPANTLSWVREINKAFKQEDKPSDEVIEVNVRAVIQVYSDQVYINADDDFPESVLQCARSTLEG